MTVETTVEKRSLFKKRENILPFEYPELLDFMNAINESFWIVNEFNYTGDIQNFHVDCTPHERTVISRAMLAISQVEVTVKRFWTDLYCYFPKEEIDLVGTAIGANEGRHFETYRKLLELLGMNNVFTTIRDTPALQKRVEYMGRFMRDKNKDRKSYVMSLVLFSLFIEHISLFSQFVTMMSFNKERNYFKGMANAISATSMEEELHGRLGLTLYNILREENPELFTDELYQELKVLAAEAFEAEMEIVDWIFDGKDLEFLSVETVKNYIRKRYNNAMTELGLEEPHIVIDELYEKVRWFDVEILASKENDFFNKRSTDYSKKTKAITADDLF